MLLQLSKAAARFHGLTLINIANEHDLRTRAFHSVELGAQRRRAAETRFIEHDHGTRTQGCKLIHFADRPLPVEAINPSFFITRKTSRTVSRDTPAQETGTAKNEVRRLEKLKTLFLQGFYAISETI